jgi:hypothetical protein
MFSLPYWTHQLSTQPFVYTFSNHICYSQHP